MTARAPAPAPAPASSADGPVGPVRWGVLATGGIAARMAGELALLPGAVRHAVASRDSARAQAFAERHGFARAYGSYGELLADPDVDVVYVATPHAQHHFLAAAALDGGTAVLAEKPLTCTLAATDDLVARSRHRGVFLMEAMRTRFVPLVLRLRELLAAGAVGEVRSVQASFGFAAPADLRHRLWDPAQGGGALLDLGVYPVSFAQMVLGNPTSLAVQGRLAPNGVDAEAGLLLGYDDGRHALLGCSLLGAPGTRAVVVGTRGRIDVEAPFHHPRRMVLHRTGAEPETVEVDHVGHGYVGQLAEVQECLRAGRTESAVMPLDDTREVMRVLESALDALGAVRADEGFPR